MKFGMWAKKQQNEFEIAAAIFSSTTTTQITAQATGAGGDVRGSKGPHHHLQDFDFVPMARAALTITR